MSMPKAKRDMNIRALDRERLTGKNDTARMPITADIWAKVTARGEPAHLAIGVLIDMREI